MPETTLVETLERMADMPLGELAKEHREDTETVVARAVKPEGDVEPVAVAAFSSSI